VLPTRRLGVALDEERLVARTKVGGETIRSNN
jgi:hypothetical protein